MNVKDTILLADINVPNNIDFRIKVRFMNEICKQLYREFPIKDEVYPFITVPGQNFYPLPDDCAEDGINVVQSGIHTYVYHVLEELDNVHSWSIVADQLMLSPTHKRT